MGSSIHFLEMTDIKIKFHLFQNKCTISVDDAALPRYSSLNNYVNRPLLDMASILFQTLSDELNDEFSLTVTGTQFEQRFLGDLRKNYKDECTSFNVEEFGVGGELRDRYSRTRQSAAALGTNIGSDYQERVFSEVELTLNDQLFTVVDDPKSATLCIASSKENAKQMLKEFPGQLILCVAEKNKVLSLSGNKFIWCVSSDELSNVAEAVVEHFAIPRYINHVAKIAESNQNTKVTESINDQKKIDISISVKMATTAIEGDEITPEFYSGNADVSARVRIESTNQNVVKVDGKKLTTIREGRADIRFYRDNEIDAFDVITLTVRPDNLVKTISLSIPEKIKTGNTYKVDAKYAPSTAPDIVTAKWTTDNKHVLAVNNDGSFKAIAEGTATITVATERASASIEVTVIPSIEKISISSEKMHMYIGEKKTVDVTLSPAGCLSEELRVKSSNPKVADISQNNAGEWVITAKGIEAGGKGKGVCRIIFSSEEGKCQSVCEVTVESTMTRTDKNGAFLTRTTLFTVLAFIFQFFGKPLGYYGALGCAAIAVLLGITGIVKTKKQIFWEIVMILISILIFATNFLLFTELQF